MRLGRSEEPLDRGQKNQNSQISGYDLEAV